MSEQLTAQAHAFIWAFNLPGFGELAEELVTEEGTQIGVPSVGTAPGLKIKRPTTNAKRLSRFRLSVAPFPPNCGFPVGLSSTPRWR